jgi:hypothetical protein
VHDRDAAFLKSLEDVIAAQRRELARAARHAAALETRVVELEGRPRVIE